MVKLQAELWKVEPIQYLVLWKFPELAAFSWKNSHAKAPINSEEYRSLLDKSERYREFLGEMPQHEIDRMVTRARKEVAEKYKAYRANEEEQRRFNQPSAKADFVYWASASYWSQDEAVALSFGRDPRHVPWSTIKPFVNISPFAKTFADRREIVCRAITMGQLYNQTIPTIFLAWAERVRLEFPLEMKQEIDKLGLVIADWKTIADRRQETVSLLEEQLRLLKDQNAEQADLIVNYSGIVSQSKSRWTAILTEKENQIDELEAKIAKGSNMSAINRERKSLLRLVIGLAIGGYGFDPKASRNSSAREICSDLQLNGLTLDEDTIRKYLNEAKEELPGDLEP